VAVGVRAAYDAVAGAYADQFYIELDAKPLDRALLEGFVELAGAGTIADVVRMTRRFLAIVATPEVFGSCDGSWSTRSGAADGEA
jgi:hypothetical protein